MLGAQTHYGLQGGLFPARPLSGLLSPVDHPHPSPGQASPAQGWGQGSLPRSPSGSGSCSRTRPCAMSMGSLSSCSRVWGSPSAALYRTFRGSASCSSFQKSEDGAWGPARGRQPGHPREHPWKERSRLKGGPSSGQQAAGPSPTRSRSQTPRPYSGPRRGPLGSPDRPALRRAPARALSSPRSRASRAAGSPGGGAGAAGGARGARGRASGPRR